MAAWPMLGSLTPEGLGVEELGRSTASCLEAGMREQEWRTCAQSDRLNDNGSQSEEGAQRWPEEGSPTNRFVSH